MLAKTFNNNQGTLGIHKGHNLRDLVYPTLNVNNTTYEVLNHCSQVFEYVLNGNLLDTDLLKEKIYELLK